MSVFSPHREKNKLSTSLITILQSWYYQTMNKSEYTETDWLIVNHTTGRGITKVFKQNSLQDVLSFSKRAIEIIEQEQFMDSAMMQFNGFECVVSIRTKSATEISKAELRISGLINEVSGA
jgi:hypothetical protein